MTTQPAQSFIDALHSLEADGDPGPLVERYADDCEVENITGMSRLRGRDGARRFWTEYRELFDAVRSTFRNVIVADGRAALEWTVEGTARKGDAVEYEGVTILEFRDDRIARSMTYFDPGRLGRQTL